MTNRFIEKLYGSRLQIAWFFALNLVGLIWAGKISGEAFVMGISAVSAVYTMGRVMDKKTYAGVGVE